jgi:hypothetical protein
MQQDSQASSRKTHRKFFIIVISILLLALFSVATVFILKSIIPNKNNSKAISASEVISSLNGSTDISSLSSKLYQKQINNSSSINFELTGKSYSVSVQTKLSTLFFAVSKSQQNDNSLVQTQMTTLMNKYKLEKSSSPDNSTNDLAYTTFVSDKAVCQLEDTNPPANSGMLRSHKLSCADKTDIDSEYTAIEKLLAIHDKSQTAIKFTKALRITKTDKNVSYSTIYLSSDTSQSILLFAAVNDNWEYLGDLSAGDIKYSTGLYIITPEIKAKISDPKYNGLIVQEIH